MKSYKRLYKLIKSYKIFLNSLGETPYFSLNFLLK